MPNAESDNTARISPKLRNYNVYATPTVILANQLVLFEESVHGSPANA